MYAYTGTAASETLSSSNWNYNWNAFNMGDGNDTVYTPSTGVAYSFRGGFGNDYFLGDRAADTASGEYGNDTLSGYSGGDYLDGGMGNDNLYGGSGRDNLSGGDGLDHLYGGTDGDYLFGGASVDYFHFVQGDSNSVTGQADVIYDWNVANDYIDSSIAGTSTNYREAATSYTTVENARWQVENNSSLRSGDHVFLYNAQTDTGFLMSDLDRNNTFETGVKIVGAGSAYDMNYSDIL